MGRAAFPALLIVWSLVVAGSASTSRPGTPPLAAQAVAAAASSRSFVDTHCAACHNDRSRTAGLSLDGLDPADIGEEVDCALVPQFRIASGRGHDEGIDLGRDP